MTNEEAYKLYLVRAMAGGASPVEARRKALQALWNGPRTLAAPKKQQTAPRRRGR